MLLEAQMLFYLVGVVDNMCGHGAGLGGSLDKESDGGGVEEQDIGRWGPSGEGQAEAEGISAPQGGAQQEALRSANGVVEGLQRLLATHEEEAWKVGEEQDTMQREQDSAQRDMDVVWQEQEMAMQVATKWLLKVQRLQEQLAQEQVQAGQEAEGRQGAPEVRVPPVVLEAVWR
ncbi:hypothetical protein E4T56_gene13380 [Termitomyces sp. T112]|nr:hypothetical protein E4T56_gene13380 [Termitomyces sp. T112]